MNFWISMMIIIIKSTKYVILPLFLNRYSIFCVLIWCSEFLLLRLAKNRILVIHIDIYQSQLFAKKDLTASKRYDHGRARHTFKGSHAAVWY